ncbi:MAG: hypothetical protein IPJ46_06860 [Anaerolineales bacterium]|nr:hypothetical protein [Anaerolineales bacterium]
MGINLFEGGSAPPRGKARNLSIAILRMVVPSISPPTMVMRAHRHVRSEFQCALNIVCKPHSEMPRAGFPLHPHGFQFLHFSFAEVVKRNIP